MANAKDLTPIVPQVGKRTSNVVNIAAMNDINAVVLPSHMRVSATNSKSTYRRVGPSTWSVPIT